MEIEIAYAGSNKQTILKLSLQTGATIEEAIIRSNILTIAEITQPISELNVGIFGKLRTLSWVIKAGDRIEIYRDLHADPKEARLIRANAQKKAQRRAYQLSNLQKKKSKQEMYQAKQEKNQSKE